MVWGEGEALPRRSRLSARGIRNADDAAKCLAAMAGTEMHSRERLGAIAEEILVRRWAQAIPMHASEPVAPGPSVGRADGRSTGSSSTTAAIHRLCYLCGRSDSLSEQMARRPSPRCMLEPAPSTASSTSEAEGRTGERLSFERRYDGRLRAVRLSSAGSLRIGLRDVAMDVRLEIPSRPSRSRRGVLEAAWRRRPARSRRLCPTAAAVLGLGKLGGRELHYNSDLDVVFVSVSDDPSVYEPAYAVARRLVQDCGAAPEA